MAELLSNSGRAPKPNRLSMLLSGRGFGFGTIADDCNIAEAVPLTSLAFPNAPQAVNRFGKSGIFFNVVGSLNELFLRQDL